MQRSGLCAQLLRVPLSILASSNACMLQRLQCAAHAGRLAANTAVDMELYKVHLTIPPGGICVSYTTLQSMSDETSADESQLALLLPVEPPADVRDAAAAVQRLVLAGMLVHMLSCVPHDSCLFNVLQAALPFCDSPWRKVKGSWCCQARVLLTDMSCA